MHINRAGSRDDAPRLQRRGNVAACVTPMQMQVRTTFLRGDDGVAQGACISPCGHSVKSDGLCRLGRARAHAPRAPHNRPATRQSAITLHPRFGREDKRRDSLVRQIGAQIGNGKQG